MGEVDVLRPFKAPADENQAVAIEQHHADAGAIGEIFEFHRAANFQLCFDLFATALIGTRSRPRLSAAFAHLAISSIDTGSADAIPTATLRSRAVISRRPSARSIS